MSKKHTILVNNFPVGLALYGGGAKTDEEIKKINRKYFFTKSYKKYLKTKAPKRKNKLL